MKKLTVLFFFLIISIGTISAQVVPVLHVSYWHSTSEGFLELRNKCEGIGGELISAIQNKRGSSSYDSKSFAGGCRIGSTSNVTHDSVLIPVLNIEYWHSKTQGFSNLEKRCEDLGGELVSKVKDHISNDKVYSYAGMCEIQVIDAN